MTRAHEKQGNVLVIAAHPDDEVLGCGGTIARLADEGHQISIAILGEGVTSRYSSQDKADKNLIRHLHLQSHKVAHMLGAENLQIFNLPDNRFDTVAMLDIVKIIEEYIEKVKPAYVFTHHHSDLNLDHVLTNRATLIATRPVVDTPVKTVLSYEVPSSTDWSFRTTGPAFQPNLFIDISETIDSKIDALQVYDSENRSYPHPRSFQSLRAIACKWGGISGMRAAEAFELVRSLQGIDEVIFCR